jgi:hypothetical protein
MKKTDYRGILSRKMKALFPDTQKRAEVIAVLESYGTEKYEQEPYRVRLAILKLAGTDLLEIQKTTEQAKQDFRDVLTWAEYSRQGRSCSLSDGAEKQKLIAADKADYAAWLNS